jgi:protein-serine/threonine kinase
MSSAALQAAPHQPTSVGSHSPVATSSTRPYTGSSSQSRGDAYYNQAPTNASPSSTRRATRRPSGNGATANNNPQQTQYYSPSGSTSSPTAVNARSTNSPVATTAAPSGYPVMAPGDHQRGVPPVVSPRTSSNRNASHAAASAADRSSRRTAYTTEQSNSPRLATTGDGQQDRAERQRSNGNTQTNGADRDREDPAATAARARRRAQQQQPEAIPHRPSGSREPRATGSASASAVQRQAMAAAAGAQSPAELSREASEVLNRVIISKPEVDIEREQQRMAEAIPSSPNAQSTPGGLSVVGSEGVEDSGRGSRSRHDHTTSKGSKNSKFGDYYLGNTLGEGEFGKVKMGWKQEGGVQVGYTSDHQKSPANISRLLSSSSAVTVSAQTPQDLQRSIARLPSSERYPILTLYVCTRWWRPRSRLVSFWNTLQEESSSTTFSTIDI